MAGAGAGLGDCRPPAPTASARDAAGCSGAGRRPAPGRRGPGRRPPIRPPRSGQPRRRAAATSPSRPVGRRWAAFPAMGRRRAVIHAWPTSTGSSTPPRSGPTATVCARRGARASNANGRRSEGVGAAIVVAHRRQAHPSSADDANRWRFANRPSAPLNARTQMEQSAVLFNREPIGHAGDIVADPHPRAGRFVLSADLRVPPRKRHVEAQLMNSRNISARIRRAWLRVRLTQRSSGTCGACRNRRREPRGRRPCRGVKGDQGVAQLDRTALPGA